MADLLISFRAMSASSDDIRSQPRGPHWIAWIVRPGGEKPDKPDRGIVFVGATQEDAEARARAFAQSSGSTK
jgi:hypothetical protein